MRPFGFTSVVATDAILFEFVVVVVVVVVVDALPMDNVVFVVSWAVFAFFRLSPVRTCPT